MTDTTPEQLELLPAPARVRRALEAARRSAAGGPAGPDGPAPELPVARVLVDVPLPHLDKPFDYLVPAALDTRVVPGSRVKVRFAGQDVDGFVLERVARSDHEGGLAPLRRAVSAEPVLTAEVAQLCAAVAERYAGTRSDVLRLAVPPRHAAAEKALAAAGEHPARPMAVATGEQVDDAGRRSRWRRYRGGEELLDALEAPNDGDRTVGRAGRGPDAGGRPGPRAVWTAVPGEDWARRLAEAAAATASAGRGAVLCAPDRRDLALLDAALLALLGEGRHVVLSADLGPAARYTAFLAVSRGHVQVVAGTRAAAFAPVRDLGLVAMWDDGDDSHVEPRAPYPHAREVLLLRAHHTGCAALLGAFARSVEAAALVSSGWARELVAERPTVRELAPRVSIPGATDRDLERDPDSRSSRIPSLVHQVVRDALQEGPVLVQAPRAGYVPVLACERCRHPARCPHCAGPLRLTAPADPPSCGWCARAVGFTCPGCGHHGVRAPVVGERRTAEELGRAFPRVPVRRSSGERVLDEVDARPAIVVATPGAEPRAPGGYAAAVLLDTWLVLARPDLRSAEEAVRRWLNAAALVRSADRGGRVVAVGDPAHPALQALVRWDPAGFAEREAAERVSAHLPPASRVAVLTGVRDAVESAAAALTLPPGAEVLGPVPVLDPRSMVGRDPGPQGLLVEDDLVRLVLRVPRRAGPALSAALRELQGRRSARKLPPVRVQVDPWELG